MNISGGTGYEDFIHVSATNGSNTFKYRDVIHEEVSKVLVKYGVRNRGKKSANFHVLRATRMSSILTEAAFIDNANDQRLLTNQAFLNDLADAQAVGIARALGLKAKATTPPQPAPKPVVVGGQVGMHRVISDGKNIGAWSNQSYLLRAVEKAIESGASKVEIQKV